MDFQCNIGGSANNSGVGTVQAIFLLLLSSTPGREFDVDVTHGCAGDDEGRALASLMGQDVKFWLCGRKKANTATYSYFHKSKQWSIMNFAKQSGL